MQLQSRMINSIIPNIHNEDFLDLHLPNLTASHHVVTIPEKSGGGVRLCTPLLTFELLEIFKNKKISANFNRFWAKSRKIRGSFEYVIS